MKPSISRIIRLLALLFLLPVLIRVPYEYVLFFNIVLACFIFILPDVFHGVSLEKYQEDKHHSESVHNYH